MRSGLFAVGGALLAAACVNAGAKDDGDAQLTQAQAQACISVAADPDQPVMGSFDVQRLTNTCAPDINVAFCSSDGRPACDAPEMPNLSMDEWTRAFITQGTAGQVSYYACGSPQTVDLTDWATDGTASCIEPS